MLSYILVYSNANETSTKQTNASLTQACLACWGGADAGAGWRAPQAPVGADGVLAVGGPAAPGPAVPGLLAAFPAPADGGAPRPRAAPRPRDRPVIVSVSTTKR